MTFLIRKFYNSLHV